MKRLLALLVILVVMVSAWTSVSLAGQRNQLRQRVTQLEEQVAYLVDWGDYLEYRVAMLEHSVWPD